MIITGKYYDALKWVAQILLPALGTFYAAIAGLWGLPSVLEVTGTVLAADTFLGIILGISQSGFNSQVAKGTIETTEGNDGKVKYSLNLDDHPETLRSKRRAIFDIVSDDKGLS